MGLRTFIKTIVLGGGLAACPDSLNQVVMEVRRVKL